MRSISALAVLSELPRRTVQFWADNNVLEATWEKGANRAVYSDTELDLVMMLRPFAESAAPIGLLVYLAELFRSAILREDLQSVSETRHFAPLVAAARANKPAYLIVQISSLPEVDRNFEATIFTAQDAKTLGQVISKCAEEYPRRPIATINLREALKRPRVPARQPSNERKA